MNTHSVMYQPINMAQYLPFEIIAVPKDNAYQKAHALQNWTNQQFNSFKIIIKNRKEPGVKRVVISSYSKKVGVVNSDQTILSFDLFMDAPTSKRTQNRNQKKIFQMFKHSCLIAQNEDENDPYASTSSNGQDNIQNISDNDTHNHKENGADTFALRKKFVPNNTTTKSHRSFLGQCKPGGCLDPPYDEDKYPYKPTDNFSPFSIEADIDKRINQDGKFKCRDEVKAIITSEVESVKNNTPSKKVISSQLRDEENVDSTLNSLITYPHAIPSSKINITRENQNNNTKPCTSSESKPKFLINEFSEVFYMPPKKTKLKRSEAKFENKTPSDGSKILNFLINNEVTTSKPLDENVLQSPEPNKDVNQVEYENIKETSKQTKELFHNSFERKTITSYEDNNISVFKDKVNTNKKSSIELNPVVKEKKYSTKTLSQNGYIKYFENPSTSDDINKTHELPEKPHKDICEQKNLIHILCKSSKTQIKTNTKEVSSINKLSINELVDSTPIPSSTMISNRDKIEVYNKAINILYEDEKLFDISLKTSLESLEQIESGLKTYDYELSAISKNDKNNQVNVTMPILNNTNKQLQIIKPEIIPEYMIENNLTNESIQAVDILFTNETLVSLNNLPEKLTNSSLNANITITPINKQISKSLLRKDSTEVSSVINNDVITQLKYSPISFQESLKVNDTNQTKKISLQNLELQSKKNPSLSSSFDIIAKKTIESAPSNIKLTDVNRKFIRTELNETTEIDTKSVHNCENSTLEIKDSSRDFMKNNDDASVLKSALNSPIKRPDSQIPDIIIKTETDIFKHISYEEKPPTQQSFMENDGMRPVSLQDEIVKFPAANNEQQNNYEDKLKYNKPSFENEQKTNERILNKVMVNSNISSKISLCQSMETVKRSITSDTKSKSSLKRNSKNGAITTTSKEFPITLQFVESNIISTVPKVLIDGNNVTDDNVKSNKVEQLNQEKLNEINNEIRDESDHFITNNLIELQDEEKKLTSLEYEEQPNISFMQPHKELNSTAISSTAINFRSRAAKSEEKAFIQLYDLAMPIKENLEEKAAIKSLVGENNKEIRIHINSETDLTLCITKNKIPTKKVTSMTIVEEKKYIYKSSSSDKMLSNDILLQETLNSVYDSLLPLQEIISNLAEEVKLLSQQQMLIEQLLGKMEAKPLQLLNKHRTCKCNKN